jgi:nitrite reductase (NO-forming)
MTTQTRAIEGSAWPFVAASAVRTAFGIIWAIDAYLKWQPAFAAHFVGYLQNAANGQPDWLRPWFTFWLAFVTPHVDFFVWATRIIETLIAIGLLLGLARKWVYLVGMVFALLIWSTAEGFGGPYTVGATDIGPAPIYLLVFVALIAFARLLGKTPYGVDYYIGRRFPFWRRFAEWAPGPVLEQTPPRLPWRQQGVAILGIIVALVFLLGSLQSALGASSATPENAAAAVSPLQLASDTPLTQARDATLPPLVSQGDTADIALTATDANISIASGVTYQAWTFDGTVPGPTFHIRQGQTVNVTFTNKGTMDHSIDFHAAEIAPDIAYRSVHANESIQFSFVARTPGVFVYHCGTPPVLFHIGNGMYGALVVDPATPLPKADASFILVQGEWYTSQVQGNVLAGDFKKMMAATPDEVVFNGIANQYKDHPLIVKAGQRVRLYVADAGPNLSSAFHIIGAIFSAVYPDGDTAHALTGVSTYNVAPGQGVVFDVVLAQAGQYPFVDHSMRDMMIGAVGVLNATP